MMITFGMGDATEAAESIKYNCLMGFVQALKILGYRDTHFFLSMKCIYHTN